MTRLPDAFKMFPVYLRELGYYCTNQSKEDYNLEKTGKVWDISGGENSSLEKSRRRPTFLRRVQFHDFA